MSYSFTTNNSEHYIKVDSEGSDGLPIGFKDIVDYFEANPISGPIQMPASGDLCENNSAGWSINTGDADSPVDEGTITQVGSYSINTTKNGAGGFTIRYTTADDSNITGDFFNAQCAEKVILWVRTSNPNVTLDTITHYKWYGTDNYERYPATFTNGGSGWSFSADTWTKIEIDIRNDVTSLSGREWWYRTSLFDLEFSGGASGDEVYVDGLRTELEDPNPKSPYPNFYKFPVTLYVLDSYFSDDQFTFVSNLLNGGFHWYNTNLQFEDPYQLDLGSLTGGGVVFINAIGGANEGSLTFDVNRDTDVNMTGVTVTTSIDHGVNIEAKGSDGTITWENCNFYAIEDLLPGRDMLIKNCLVGNCRYPMRSWTPVTIDGYTYYGGYIYMFGQPSPMTLKGVKPVVDGRMIRSRNWYADFDVTHNIINPDFSEAGPNAYFWILSYETATAGKFIEQKVGFTLNLKVTDKDGNAIQNANVNLLDKNDSESFNVTTDSNGEITEQTIITRSMRVVNDGTRQTIVWDPRSEGTNLNPFTLRISKAGYETIKKEITLDEKKEWTISLENSPYQVEI